MGIKRGRNAARNAEPKRGRPGEAREPERAGLEQRLEALVESERIARDLLEELRAERWAAQQQESDHRLASIEKVLAEARTDAEERRQMERALAQASTEIERLTGELDQARREAEEAERTIKPRAARRVAEAEDALAEARAEVERERDARSKLVHDLEAVAESERQARETIAQQLVGAEEHAEVEQRIAELEVQLAEARAEVELERMERTELEQQVEMITAQERDARRAHEQQLSELKRALAETESTAADAQEALVQQGTERNLEREELRGIDQLRGIERMLGIEQRQGIEQLLQSLSESAQSRMEEAHQDEPLASPTQTREPAPAVLDALRPTQAKGAEEPPEAAEPAPLTKGDLGEVPERGGGILRRRRRGRMPEKDLVSCSVCKRTEVIRPEEAETSGWILRDDLRLCADCQSKGWRLPEAEGLPFRRPSDRQTSG